MKLINYKCPKCDHQEEVLLYDTEDSETIVVLCLLCDDGTTMQEYNFKNNSQR